MEKTPVSLLQEIAIKDGYVPKYIEQKCSLQNNILSFTYKVECKGYTASGVGFSKKVAKHSAANAMLKILGAGHETPKKFVESKQPAVSVETNSITNSASSTTVTPDESISVSTPTHSVSSTSSTSNLINYIGKLQEYCTSKNLTMPAYDIVKTEGPPHKPLFTIRCTIPDISEDAIASTKKIGKQLAAKKVINRLVGNFTNLPIISCKQKDTSIQDVQDIMQTLNVKVKNMKLLEDEEVTEETNKMIELYNELKYSTEPNNVVIEKTSGSKIMNYHLMYETACRTLEVPFRQVSNAIEKPLNEKLILFTKLVKEAFQLHLETIHFPTNRNTMTFIVGLRLAKRPTLLQIGKGDSYESAKTQAFQKFMELIQSYCKN